ncbi:Arabinose 5-phosphate isomerase KdsD [Marinomonas spartinae]|uniref:CBS domain-containing protein n=1 Tax=Marinomonas spartinae TaxID=1792290 RepID=UPI000808A424|nr:CBS domain-containing protein [Marinomonas spartinae]SBS31428.1 Arabinose 5-phosphate isomerase KdsD [Marinomonas spartinae]
MLARDIMVRDVVCVDMDTRLTEVIHIMEEKGFHHLPVLENDVLVGIISDRDLLRIISPFIGSVSEQSRDKETLNHAAHQVMTRQPLTVKEHSSIEEVISWMGKVAISCMPVVDADNHVVGIISWRDLIHNATY